jgi:hypothetical protein
MIPTTDICVNLERFKTRLRDGIRLLRGNTSIHNKI